MKHKKKSHILKLFRNTKCMRLADLSEKSGLSLGSISLYERGKLIPLQNTIFNLAKTLGINPDVLFYSFGYLPEKEMKIIMDDPFYYMDKIRKLCDNSRRRVHVPDEEMNSLNATRVFNYISKEGRHEDEN